MATVTLRLTPRPAHVRTARLVASAMARRSGVAEHLLDDVRLAVGEACARAVRLHERCAPTLPVTVELSDGVEFCVVVTDHAPAQSDLTNQHGGPPDGYGDVDNLGLAVLEGVVDDLRVKSGGDGTEVTMTWPTDPRQRRTGRPTAAGLL